MEKYEAAKEEKRQQQLAKEEQAQREKDEKEAFKKQQLAQEKKTREYSTKNKDVDLADIYTDLPAENYIQTEEQGIYQHHSDFWEAQMDQAAQKLSTKMEKVEVQEVEDNNHHPTID